MPTLAKIHRASPATIRQLARRLQRGELVAVPTETVYGLAANALDAAACRKIFRAKGRPMTDPLIVHLADAADLDQVAVPNEAARKLARKFWPGPLTLVMIKQSVIPAIVSAGLPSVAVRVPAHPLFRRLLRAAGLPLAAPSANPFGYISPTTAEHVRTSLGTKISHILDGGPARFGLESTIVDVRDPLRPRLLRPGVITAAEIARTLGKKLGLPPRRPTLNSPASPQSAPGLLASHYSPHTPLTLHRRLGERGLRTNHAYIYFREIKMRRKNSFVLRMTRDPRLAGRQLFALLRKLDAAGYVHIHVERAPGNGVAVAINDRLRRAAGRRI